MLARAAAANPSLAPAWEHLAWAAIRLGRQAEAARALEMLQGAVGGRDESEIYLPDLLRLAFAARFTPAARLDQAELDSPGSLGLAARGALAFDLPEHQLAFGRRLAATDDVRPADRANGLEGEAVALVALGRPARALTVLDSATALFPIGEAARQAAEWRVLLPALGLPGVPEDERAAGRQALEQLAARGDTLAAWALGVSALAAGDTAAGRRWENLTGTEGALAALLAGMDAAVRDDPAAALALSAPALAADSAGAAPDPFLRSALHLLRGQWQVRLGQLDEADRSWRWYQNTDAVGWPHAEAQAADVDWALGSYARLLRAELAWRQGRRAEACEHATRLGELWGGAEPAFGPAVSRLRTVTGWCRP
jgi:hypothetical protein